MNPIERLAYLFLFALAVGVGYVVHRIIQDIRNPMDFDFEDYENEHKNIDGTGI